MENKNTFSKLAVFLNAVLITFVVASCSGNSETELANSSDQSEIADDNKTKQIESTQSDAEIVPTTGKVVYFNMDSLTANLLLYTEIEKEMQKASQDAKAKMDNEERKIERWQKKWADKGTLMSAEQEKYQREAQDMQEKAMMFERNVQMKLQQEQEKYMSTLMLRISKATETMAKTNGYDVVNSYQLGQSPWYYNKSLDVTNALIQAMNADFEESTNMDDAE